MNLKQLTLKHNYILPPKQRQDGTKNENLSFCIRLLNVDFPASFIKDTKEKFYIKASLYDFNYKAFFGKQWDSSPLENCRVVNDIATLECNQGIYFHTSFMDEYLTVIMEVIRYKTEDKQVGVGWCVFNLFKCTKSITDLNDDQKPELISVEIYKGTPRALFGMTGFPESNPNVKSFEKSFVHLNINIHKDFNVCHNLIPEFFLLHEDDIVPGLEIDSEGFCDLENPKLTKFNKYAIEQVKVFIDPSLMEFEKELIEDINNDRLNRDGNIPIKDSSALKIIERRLRVGVHNGLMYTEDNDTIYLNVQDPQIRRSSMKRSSSVSKEEENNCLTAKNSVEMSMPVDKEFTLVLILEYTISENAGFDGNKDLTGISPVPQHTYQIRWIVYKPFAQKLSPVDLKAGVCLELEFSGGSIDAPENVLVYKKSSKKKRMALCDGDKPIEQKAAVTLVAIFREKSDKDLEPLISVKNTEDQNTDLAQEEIISTKQSRQLAEQPVPLARKTKSPKSLKTEEEDSVTERKPLKETKKPKVTKTPTTEVIPTTITKSGNPADITDSQIRAFQDFMLLQQSQNYNPPKYVSGSLSMPPAMLGVPFPNQLINMWRTQQLGADQVVDYDSIDPYVVNEKFSPSAGGKSSRMFPLQMRAHHGLGLSRAIYSKLHAAGFPEFKDCNGDAPFVVDPIQVDEIPINLDLEEKDHKQCNEIVFQFMALSRLDSNMTNVPVKSVFFTFQFYRFPVISTDRLMLDKIIDQISNYERTAPMVLRKTNASGAISDSPPGTMVKYMLDPTFMKPGEMSSFLEYLNQQVLHIDVWDGDSLLLIGSCAVNLKSLCRQGRASVQISYELDVISQSEIDEENITSISNRLHIRMANLGSVPKKYANGITVIPHQKKGMIIDATEIERFSKGSLASSKLGGSMRDIYGTDEAANDRLNSTNIVVRPQPAVLKNRELSEMLEKRSTTNGDISMSPVKKPLMNEDVIRGKDHDKAKKLERFKNALRRLESESTDVDSNKLILEAKRSDKVDKQRVLQTIQCYREQQKGDTIRKLLNGVIEKEITLYPKFGCTELFEVKIKNHFNVDSNVNIEISDTSNFLVPVINPSELRALKTLFSVTTASESDLINFDKDKNLYQIFMKSKESVLVPFKYTNMIFPNNPSSESPALSSPVKQTQKLSQGDIEYQIVFRTSENKLLSILRVKIVPQPPVTDQTFRFFHPEQSFLRRLIRLPPLQIIAGPNDSIKTLSRCTDIDVTSDCQPVPVGTPHDVSVKIPCGPAPQVRQFLIALYVDKFLLKPIQVWHFTVHSKSRIDVVAHQGQTTNMTLLLKGTSGTHHVSVFSSHPDEMSVASIESSSFTLAAHTTYELSMSLTPLKIGNRKFQVNVVDIDSHTLVRSWVICAMCKEPEISKMFEMELPVGGGDVCKKRIGFQNPYPNKRKFYLSTDRPDLMMLKDSILTIGANEVENIGMVFVPVIQRGKQKIFVFINDEDGKNEETFALIVNYQ